MDALAFGAAAAASLRIPGSVELLRYWSVPLSSAGWVLFLVTVFVTRAYSMFDPVCETLGQTILAAVFTLAVIMVSVPKVGRPSAMYRGLSVPPLRVIGRYSFAMYVFHLPLHVFVGVPLLRRYVPAVPAWAAVVYTVVITITTFLLAALSYWLFESHFLRLKRYFVPTIRSGNLANGVDRGFAG
jgi:peptidoglycan/LPS O-acetylase OafA/YrhL